MTHGFMHKCVGSQYVVASSRKRIQFQQRHVFMSCRMKHNVRLEASENFTQQGLIFNTPDRAAFQETLTKSGFYQTWQAKFGPALWSALEKFTGPLA